MTWVYQPPPPRLTPKAAQEIKERLTMQAVAERYGFAVERGKIICPFHGDTRPSCTVYPGTRGFYCFACNTGGSVIDFVAKLLGLGYLEAAARLNDDFGLRLSQAEADSTALPAWQAKRDAKRQAAEESDLQRRLLSQEAKALRRLPKPRTHRAAAQHGAGLGRLAYFEYLIEETIYPYGG